MKNQQLEQMLIEISNYFQDYEPEDYIWSNIEQRYEDVEGNFRPSPYGRWNVSWGWVQYAMNTICADKYTDYIYYSETNRCLITHMGNIIADTSCTEQATITAYFTTIYEYCKNSKESR